MEPHRLLQHLLQGRRRPWRSRGLRRRRRRPRLGENHACPLLCCYRHHVGCLQLPCCPCRLCPPWKPCRPCQPWLPCQPYPPCRPSRRSRPRQLCRPRRLCRACPLPSLCRSLWPLVAGRGAQRLRRRPRRRPCQPSWPCPPSRRHRPPVPRRNPQAYQPSLPCQPCRPCLPSRRSCPSVPCRSRQPLRPRRRPLPSWPHVQDLAAASHGRGVLRERPQPKAL
mmetsp:Transcript_66670/g.210889  ORF Transcript_66670/g.210889 Transcript_66670/m.210889 type:complete len:223 (-) Transcript_66670:210-878(-)